MQIPAFFYYLFFYVFPPWFHWASSIDFLLTLIQIFILIVQQTLAGHIVSPSNCISISHSIEFQELALGMQGVCGSIENWYDQFCHAWVWCIWSHNVLYLLLSQKHEKRCYAAILSIVIFHNLGGSSWRSPYLC